MPRPIRPPDLSPAYIERLGARLWAMVDRSGGPDACWPWLGAVDGHGYGIVRLSEAARGVRGFVKAHRLAVFLSTGRWPGARELVLHDPAACGSRACCNPAHLRVGSYSDNAYDAVLAGTHHQSSKRFCKHGHEFTPENTGIGKRGDGRTFRSCLTCRRIRNRKAQP